jgi:hypothetical protein
MVTPRPPLEVVHSSALVGATARHTLHAASTSIDPIRTEVRISGESANG